MATEVYKGRVPGLEVLRVGTSFGPALQLTLGRVYVQLSPEEAQELAVAILRGAADDAQDRHVCPACKGPQRFSVEEVLPR